MANRPTYIEVPPRRDGSAHLALPSPRSPRFQHFDGDIPPSLSPLDAFAAQSRALARQLDQEQREGRRMSRLPPAMVKKSLSIPRSDRPEYLRSASSGERPSPPRKDSEQSYGSVEIEAPKFRPISEHPRLSGISFGAEEDDGDDYETPIDTSATVEVPANSSNANSYFDIPRTASPETTILPPAEVQKQRQPVEAPISRSEPFPPISVKMAEDSFANRAANQPSLQAHYNGLQRPPKLHHESSDDDYTSSNAGSTFSDSRKLSASSGISAPHSPLSPFVAPHPRSPSVNSEASAAGYRLSRPAFNFSRPLSSASLNLQADAMSRSSQDAPNDGLRLADLEYPSAPYSNDDARSVNSDGYLSGAGTYTHAKFSLPRGRMVSRNSLVFGGLNTPHFEWQEPLFQPPTPTMPRERSFDRFGTTLNGPSASSPAPEFSFGFSSSRPKTPERKPENKPSVSPAASSSSVASANSARPSVERGDLRAMRGRAPVTSHEDGQSSRSNSTIRAHSTKTSTTATVDMSPEDHLTKAIACHESGSLKESTYHLRLAATANHPTAMLLYALACRHGWGIRANQREGVQWLRKAVDCAGLEVAEDQEGGGAPSSKDFIEKKARRAQFALGIYELGVSHLNGWGIEQDKALALRCFEIAGNWGDPDALAEAGFCYAEGIGCKKDLKKAAKFYRLAEAKGMSMVGNSWIYKDKYNDKDEASSSPEKGKPKSRNRSKSLFGRKKSHQP